MPFAEIFFAIYVVYVNYVAQRRIVPDRARYLAQAAVTQYFDYNYSGPAFELFGTGHLIALSIIGAIVAFLVWGWKDPSDDAKRRARLLIVIMFLLTEVSWHGWNLANGTWNIQYHLPLHLCSIAIWSTTYILITRSYRVYEIVYFFGIIGASQTVLTPEAGIYGLPHFRAIQTLAAHGMVVIALVYLTAIEGFRPTWTSVWKTMLVLNIYLVIVTGINYMLGSNYMYTMQKPDTASLLDLMGPWPWYLLTAEFLALLLFSLIYLPFALADKRARETGKIEPYAHHRHP